MSPRLFAPPLALLPLAALLAAPPPAAAEWLVTRDGERVETEGPWEVRGELVVFTLAGSGSLASIHRSEIDLEVSREVSEAAERPPEPPPEPPPPRPAVLVLTDEDVAHVDDEEKGEGAAADGRAAESAEPGDAGATAPDSGGDPGDDDRGDEASESARHAADALVITTQRRLAAPSGQGIEIFGTLENTGGAVARGIELVVELLDRDGELLVEGRAELSRRNLRPGGKTNFRARFPGIPTAGDVAFDIRTRE